ncbi:hypothetical protein L914_21560 [Phytophthora nicotianae]|uniref:Uncharacterized protein n=2 Tax=Phytophthora nicotianae TaxID=4792 RepID=V9DTQ7_PHYNI|nr:hypothetical protein F443_23158 [Phytophthora nicotianae P1569]ETM30767.1 hypothetical protein L914_21560 [Phytophthora nicotianae]
MFWKKLPIHSGILGLFEFTVLDKDNEDFPARFLLELPYGRKAPVDDFESLRRGKSIYNTKPKGVLRGELVFFCGVEQDTRRSKEYDATLTKIIDIWRENQQQLGDIPDEIEVPITVKSHPAVSRTGGGMITYAQNVLNAVRHIREHTWPRAVKREGMPRVTFVLDLLERICGLYLFDPTFRQEIGVRGKQGAARKVVGKLLASLFGGAPAGQRVNGANVLTISRVKTSGFPSQIELSSMNFYCEPNRPWFFERFCSAAVVNQTSTHVSIVMQIAIFPLQLPEEDPELVARVYPWRWQWVCYGFFSKRARQLSRLERLTLQNVRVCTEDVEAMRVVMLSECPEEELLGIGQSQEPRDVTIKPKASLRLQPMGADEKLGSNASFSVSREIRGVKILSNTTDKGWVDVLVPGFGKCQTRKSNLVQIDDTTAKTTEGLSLVLTLVEDPDDELMCEFFGFIGGSLQDLTIRVSNFRTAMLERITAKCPRVKEIAVCTPNIEARFHVRDSRLQHPIVVHPTAPPSFENTVNLIRSFAMKDRSFARSLRRLRVRILRNYGDASTTPPLKECCTALLNVLEVNRTVEYLDVVTSTTQRALAVLFDKYEHEKLPVAQDELPVESKLAFLSIMPLHDRQDGSEPKRSRRSCCLVDLDRNSVSLIFAFVATPVTRKVVFGGAELRDDQNPI